FPYTTLFRSVVDRLELLVWSHIDNAFGRNPVGRHFSHYGPEEIEGVDMGWYNRHQGGIGLLEEVRFVFDGSPKSFHYPNQPEVGNLGWTEGWVQFNTAFNTRDRKSTRLNSSHVKISYAVFCLKKKKKKNK